MASSSVGRVRPQSYSSSQSSSSSPAVGPRSKRSAGSEFDFSDHDDYSYFHDVLNSPPAFSGHYHGGPVRTGNKRLGSSSMSASGVVPPLLSSPANPNDDDNTPDSSLSQMSEEGTISYLYQRLNDMEALLNKLTKGQ